MLPVENVTGLAIYNEINDLTCSYTLSCLKSERIRLSTFRIWFQVGLFFKDRHHDFPDPKKLAKSGFFYFNRGDFVQCIFCHLIFHRWLTCLPPDFVHRRCSPQCPRFRSNSGNISMKEGEDLQFEKIEIPSFEKLSPNLIVLKSCDLTCQEMNIVWFNSGMKFPEFRVCLKREESVEEFDSKYWIRKNRYRYFQKKKIAEAGFFYDEHENKYKCFFCGVRFYPPAQDPWVDHVLGSSTCPFVLLKKSKEFIAQVIKQEMKDIKHEDGRLTTPRIGLSKGKKKCSVCSRVFRRLVFLQPCRHSSACLQCCAKREDCPICFTAILSFVEMGSGPIVERRKKWADAEEDIVVSNN